MDPAAALDRFELSRRNNAHTKFYRVKHGVIIICKQTAVIAQGHQSGDRKTSGFTPDHVTDRQIIIICIHPVNGDLARSCRQTALHQAGQINLTAVFVNTHHGIVKCDGYLTVIKLI